MTSKELVDQIGKKRQLASVLLLVVMFVLGALGLIVFRAKEKEVFPSASIDLRMPKKEILALAQGWAKKIGYERNKLVKSITFDYDAAAKTFLEYELGNAHANQLMRDTVPIFYWTCRFRKEFDPEKVDVYLSPAGKLVAFNFDLPNDRRIPSISHDAAKAMALAFVQEGTGWSDSSIKLVEDETIACPNRTDHSFTWENQSLDLNGAKLRARAQISGNFLSNFYEFLHRPEKWDRQYSTIRSNNELLYSIAEIFYVLIYIASAFIFFDALSKRNVRWKFVLIAAGVCASVFVLDELNDLPEALSGYASQSSYAAFVTQSVLTMLVQAPLVFAAALIVCGAAEIVYRGSFVHKIAMEKLFTASSLTSRQTIEGLLAGVAACAISLGYQICYYWLGEHVHYWCPLSLDNYQLLTAAVPSFSAFSLGFFASGSEELLYRVIMLALVQRLVGRFWWANIIQAAAWGFMHSNYPQQPAYARGIELTLEGIFDGWLLKRFGFIACFAGHYLFDAFCVVLPLWSAPTAYHKISACLPLLPVLILPAIGLLLRKKAGLAPEETLLNSAIPGADVSHLQIGAPRAAVPFVYKPLTDRWRRGLAVVALIGFLMVICFKPTTQLCDHPKPLTVSRVEAVKIAAKHLSDLHFDLNGYYCATSLVNGTSQRGLELQYAFETIGFAKTNKLVEQIEHPYIWSVRYVKPLTPEEYDVSIDAQGQVLSQTITRAEDAVGANLSEAGARAIAEEFIKTYRKLYVPFQFDDVKVQRRKHRIDYEFTFKVPKFKVGEAEFIVTGDVIGDMPSSFAHYWRIPDQWRWEREKEPRKEELCKPLRIAFISVVSVAFVWWVVSLFRAHVVHWRKPYVLALLACIPTCLQSINFSPGYFNMYVNTMPIQYFYIMGVVGFLIALAFALAAITFTIAVAWGGLKPDELKDKCVGTFLLIWPFGTQNSFKTRRDFCLDALLMGTTYAVCMTALSTIGGVARFHLGHNVQVNNDFQHLNAMANCLCPVLDLIMTQVQSAAFGLLAVALAVGFGIKFKITNISRYGLVVVITLAIMSSSMRYWQDYLLSLTAGLITALSFWLLLRLAVRRNMLTLLVVEWLALMVPYTQAVYEYGLSLFPFELATLCASLIAPLVYLVYLQWRVVKSGKLA